MNTQLNTFVVADPHKCIGCKVCEVACAMAHSDRKITTAGTFETPVISKLYLVKTAEITMPIQCRHCEDATCANVCPISAIKQVDNKILIDETTCIGCKTCMMACPFGAIDLAPVFKEGAAVIQNILRVETTEGLIEKEMVVANKCDLCAGRVNGPACVEACPEKALEVITPKKEKKKRNIEAALSLKKFIG
ncbi:4Fe-4S dicluster domain-containing protein [Sporomusa sp.]|uniref:4Fe-4S dicluster domain-containing protein n=1 Tax=Sporomusa sp. TaxID=2078658 RepID=UPI002C00BA45|nr:4Fe-4S dicluster domain-containing protein [Sporomusa sp.]HWR41782.1 4Fe-4S dicluster domain-containing protein [Sporomusa sp.]